MRRDLCNCLCEIEPRNLGGSDTICCRYLTDQKAFLTLSRDTIVHSPETTNPMNSHPDAAAIGAPKRDLSEKFPAED